MSRTLASVAVATLAVTMLSGCFQKNDVEGAIKVTSTADTCEVATNTATSGAVRFEVKNAGSKVTEFYILASDGLRIVGEVENIAPGVSRNLTIQAQPGSYYTVCKPGMVGEGMGQTAFTVTGEALKVNAEDAEATNAAVASYTAYTKSQVGELVAGVKKFTDAYKAGDDDEARALFPLTRINYERIEPTAEQFGDLDPKIDYRKPGAEAEKLDFTGFHRIEMDLWLDEAKKNYPGEKLVALTPAERTAMADLLVTDIQALYDKVHAADFTLAVGEITNGAIGLLDEIAAPDGKLPGEEDEFSHTDLYDFYANVEGAQVAFEAVRELAAAKGAEGAALVKEIDGAFVAMKELLSTYGNYKDGFVFYDTVPTAERNKLAAALNGLSEPMSKLTHTVLGVEQG